MRPRKVWRLDFRLPGPNQAVLRDPRRQRLLAYAAAAGLIAGLLIVLGLRFQGEALRQVQGSLRAELDALQAAQRQGQTELQGLRELEAAWQERQAHQARWLQARDTGWVLGRLAAAVPTGRLTQWTFDGQGWTLTGQIPADDLQSWLDAWQAQAPGLGPMTGLELAREGRELRSANTADTANTAGDHADNPAGAEKSLRFVLRFAHRADPASR